ncbi:ABC transporter permease [Gracilibacillus alcaliphilus]|uniref:ABC transporter permease n=1 Tax=Gracilibacillus alcaliphilus TaxID=1401441 RepID=UPI001957CA24|nr:ABC transporter permease [Gracilibacillus alcaliphilus]MBM7676509.1 ABC-2 type transport system permease protein [Gracilibacillus alcaliphilus]
MHLFKGSKWLLPILLRQHRMRLIYWLAGLTLITVTVVASYQSIYGDTASREAFGLTMENPTMIAMLGIGYDNYHVLGSLFAMEMLLFSAIAVAMMNILLVAKMTRDDEEQGILELVQARSVGRLSYLHSSLVVMLVSNLLLTLLLTIGIGSLQIDGMNWHGAVLYSSLLGGTGIFFGCLTALFSQLVETSRTSMIFSFGAVLILYLLRAIGDVEFTALSYISPLGWLARAYVFTDNDWWPVVGLLAAAILLTLITYYLQSIRDIGAGFIPERKGRKNASALLQTKLGLVFHLQKTMILSWLAGILIMGIASAAILPELEKFFQDNEALQAFLTANGSLMEQFILLMMSIMIIFISAPVIMSVLRLHGEEKAQRTEVIYSKALSRAKLYRTYTWLAVLIACIFPLLLACSIWGVGFFAADEMMAWEEVFGAAIVYIPALLVLAGIALFLLGWLPKLISLVWLFVIYGFVVIYLGDLLDLPKGIKLLSIYEHIPMYPSEDFSWGVILSYLLISALLIVFGFVGYRRRDMEG